MTETKNNIVTGLLSVNEIVKNNFFKIPDYQRGYSWEIDQLDDLIKDIEHIANKEHRHYTGTIVITKNVNGKNDVVDGQQRLTTLIILLKTIFDTDPVKYSSIKENFIIRDDQYVLETNKDTKDFFKDAILGTKKNLVADIKSKQNLLFAKEYFLQWLKNNSSIDKIYSTIINKLGFICFSPQNTNEIGIMFEVINNRGKELSELEKIKNYFIYYATIHSNNLLRDKINTSWGPLLKHLSEAHIVSNDDENRYLRNCFIVFYSANKQKSWNVYDELKEKYKPEDIEHIDDKIKEIINFIDFIEQAAQSYAFFSNDAIFKREYSGKLSNEISKSLSRIRCHPVNASIMPLYLATMTYLFDNPQEVLNILNLIEIVNFRTYVIPNTKIARADSKQGDLFNWARELYIDRDWHSDNDENEYFTWKDRKIEGDIFAYIKMYLEDFVQVLCPEEIFIQSLTIDNDESIDYYNWNGLRFFLASYEEKLNEERKESWDIERILISREDAKKKGKGNDYLSKEHIWAKANRVADFPEDWKEKRRLGNFVLLGLSSNIQLQDDEIENKVDFLIKNSSISMLQVNKLKDYTCKAIQKASSRRDYKTKYYFLDIAISIADQRETDLIKFALDRWKLPNEKFVRFINVDAFKANDLSKNENYFLLEKN